MSDELPSRSEGAIAYISATIQGQQIKRKGIQKYVGRVKEYGCIERRYSSLYIGLDGQSWVNQIFMGCKEARSYLSTGLTLLGRTARGFLAHRDPLN